MKLLCRLGIHKWLYDRHYTSLGVLETDCVMLCGDRVLKYRNCVRCNLFQVSFDGNFYGRVSSDMVLRLREDWEEEVFRKDKARQLEKLKLQVISQNTRGLMVSFPVASDAVASANVPVKKCDVRSIDDED